MCGDFGVDTVRVLPHLIRIAVKPIRQETLRSAHWGAMLLRPECA